MTKIIKGHNNDAHKAILIGKRFQMDYAFVRGTYRQEGKSSGPLVTSVDECNAYLIITNEVSRDIWVFTTRGTDPPIDIVDSFLDKYKRTDGNRYIRMDRGGGLSGSHAFQALVKKHNYVLEMTVPDSSFQNGIVEQG